MRASMTPEESLALIQPTVGWEGELHQIVFVVVRDKKIIFAGDVLNVFEAKEDGIRCVDDYTTENRKEVDSVAKANKLTVSSQYRGLHILEFVTSPTKKMEELEKQLTEIARLEKDLIHYIFQRKQENELMTLLCIKDWIDDYNRRFTQAQLTETDATKEMYILVDYSITLMKESVKKFTLESLQENLKHSVQYNFVAALGKKMGSQLINLLSTKNKEHNKEQVMLLMEAENNGEKACQWIRSKSGSTRKLAKLSGFLFLLSLRVVTEISYIPYSEKSSEKNKYLYFLKTKLSELILSLSENDKKILEELSKKSDEEKKQFLVLIAGSSEALTVGFKVGQTRFTLRDVLESTLGWRGDKICDLLPNAPTNDIQTPFEPKDAELHHNPHTSVFRRVLLENRSKMNKTTDESLHDMQEMLKHSSDLSMTTFLKKKYGISSSQPLMSEIKSVDAGVIIDNNMRVAEKIIEKFRQNIHDYKTVKMQLNKLLSHPDRDITFKQINYLFIKMQNQDQQIDKMLMELFAEKITDFFPPVLNDEDKSYLKYISTRYLLSARITEVSEYLRFVEKLNLGFLRSFEISMFNKDKQIELNYRIKPGIDINSKDKKGNTELYYACKFGLEKLIHTLLMYGAIATSNDLIYCLDKNILTKDLADKLMLAGANAGRVLCCYAEENDTKSIQKLIEIIGKEKLNIALEDYVESRPHQMGMFLLLQPFLTAESHESTASLTHSVMFPVPGSNNPEISPAQSLTESKKYER